MKHKYLLFAFLSTTLLLSACTGDNNENSNSSSNTSQDNSQSSNSPVIPMDDEYVVHISNTSSLVKITADKQKAKKDEVVTLTIELEENVTLTKILVNESDDKVTKVNDLKYTFVMPNRDAIVKPVLSINADVALVGDIAAALVLENGVYVARNVEVASRSHISYAVKNKQGEVEELSIVKLNNKKCNADLSMSNTYDNGFEIAGNAKYDFFYDPTDSEMPCYIQRVGLLHAPKDIKEFESLLAGTVKSDPSTYPSGLNHVHYTSTKSNDDYTWDLYDNASFATVKKLGTNEETGIVYKNLNNGLLTVVDTYIEGDYDDSKREDTKLYSAKYNIVDEIQDGYSRYQKTINSGVEEANEYSHDIYSLDRNIHYGYRTGFDLEFNDSLEASDVKFEAKENEDGTYLANINSYKTMKEVTDTNGNTSGKQEHIEYTIEVKFNNAGNVLTASFVETHFDSTGFDFAKNEFLPNGQEQGVVEEEMHIEYTYGDKKEGKPSFDYRPYFVNEIVSAKVVNEKMEKENQLTLENTVADYLKIEVLPETALDVDQYGVISSSNLDVIKPSHEKSPFDFRVYGTGVTTLIVSNHVDNTIKKEFEVEVPSNIKIRDFYMQNTDGDWDNINSKNATIKANTIREVYCYAHAYTNIEFNFTPVSSDESLLKVSRKGQRLVLDATGAKNITQNATVTVRINCDLYEDPSKVTEFTITIEPNQQASQDAFVGTWVGKDSEHSNQDVTMTLNADGTGKIVASSKAKDGFNITYSYDANLGNLKISGPDYSYSFVVKYDSVNNTIGIIVWTYAWGDEYENDLIGYYLADEEGYELEVVYCTLTKQ